jgi:hypothetical protein
MNRQKGTIAAFTLTLSPIDLSPIDQAQPQCWGWQ